MGWLKAINKTNNPQATELDQLKEELRRVSGKLESHESELAEALEQQTATSEILRVITSLPTDIQTVLDAVTESAARLCNATDALIARTDGDVSSSARGGIWIDADARGDANHSWHARGAELL